MSADDPLRRIVERPSPNHGPRPPGSRVELLILHYTGMVGAEAALARLCDTAAGVSAHYLVDLEGTIFRLVPEHRRAWHAGVGSWRGKGDVNGRSVGIEIDNPGHEWGYRPFPAGQMAAVAALARAVLDRHPIPPEGVLGHSDVAPQRKIDPGERFDWPGLAAAGIGHWPAHLGDPTSDEPPFDAAEGLRRLARYGYETEVPSATIRAFQRHFRPSRVDGVPDAETLWRIARLVPESR